MLTSQNQLETLKSRGCRMTKIRQALFDLFNKKDQLYVVAEIQAKLAAEGITPNKTTLYRELTSLEDMGIVEEILLQGTRAYTAAHPEHHHHLICTNCHKVISIDTPELETALTQAEKTASKESGFRIFSHEVTLFGLCPACI